MRRSRSSLGSQRLFSTTMQPHSPQKTEKLVSMPFVWCKCKLRTPYTLNLHVLPLQHAHRQDPGRDEQVLPMVPTIQLHTLAPLHLSFSVPCETSQMNQPCLLLGVILSCSSFLPFCRDDVPCSEHQSHTSFWNAAPPFTITT